MARRNGRPKTAARSALRASTKSMKTYTYTILVHKAEADEKGYWVEVPALPGCFTDGQTIEQCIERAQEAIQGYLEAIVKVGEPIPEEPQSEDSVISKVRVNLPVPA